ncbi:hypothetical protein GGU11DRAFT_514918 [Lentinula aff. detonsa]|nr:hypothetical protein GGU11DRAFT_514918 [Lentinula aff. detonsa]
MHDETVDYFPWLDSNAPNGVGNFKMPEVKEESHTDFSSMFSPPSSPFINNSALTSQSLRRRNTKSESPRTRPYPELHPSEDSIGMSGTSGSGYDNWNNRSRGSNERRSSVGDYPLYQPATYDPSNSGSLVRLSRSSSASSSSFNSHGAIGASPSGSGTRYMSMSPRHSDAQLVPITWHQDQIPIGATSDLLYPGVAGDVPYHLSSDTDQRGYGEPSSSTIYSYDETTTPVTGYAPTTYNGSTMNSHAHIDYDLHRRIAELEDRHLRDQEQIKALQAQLADYSSGSSGSSSSSPPDSALFQASWEARTNARIKYLCSLNRAGNALCAWHDPRRERRKYPPRHAPLNTLNCGCTYEEALFEESLARHKVGNYLPGNLVRMDPALRNPLLRLLKERYGYRDGDFERDPVTKDWKEEDGHKEGHEYWERLLVSGVHPRRARGDQHHNTTSIG